MFCCGAFDLSSHIQTQQQNSGKINYNHLFCLMIAHNPNNNYPFSLCSKKAHNINLYWKTKMLEERGDVNNKNVYLRHIHKWTNNALRYKILLKISLKCFSFMMLFCYYFHYVKISLYFSQYPLYWKEHALLLVRGIIFHYARKEEQHLYLFFIA